MKINVVYVTEQDPLQLVLNKTDILVKELNEWSNDINDLIEALEAYNEYLEKEIKLHEVKDNEPTITE